MNAIQVTIYCKVKQELCTAFTNPRGGESWLRDSGWTDSVLYNKSLNAIQVTSQGEAGVETPFNLSQEWRNLALGLRVDIQCTVQQKLEWQTGCKPKRSRNLGLGLRLEQTDI